MSDGPYPLPGVAMPTWLIRFDKKGVCTSPQTQARLLDWLKQTPHTDVLFYSHGWNSDFDAAVDQYSRFLTAFEAVSAAHPPKPGFEPVFVGVTWPSTWFPGSKGPDMAAVSVGDTPADLAVEPARLEVADAIADPDRRARFYALTDSSSITQGEALELAGLMAPLVSPKLEDLGLPVSEFSAEDLLDLAQAFDGDASSDDLDAIGVVGGAGSPGLATAGDFNPFKLLRVFSVYQMKDRAGYVGARGVSNLLHGLLSASARPIHVFGHSFGAKVMLAAVCAHQPPRPVQSLLLLQPAISHLALARPGAIPGRPGPGGYHGALDGRVSQPVFSTHSEMDDPLHNKFHLGLRRVEDLGELKALNAAGGEPPDRYAALGGYGPRHSDEQQLSTMLAPGEDWPDLTGRIIGLDGSKDQITSHGDVANRFTAWALHRLIKGA